MREFSFSFIAMAFALALAILMSITGCGWPPLPPEAWTEVAKREVSIRVVGMTAVEPHSGMIFCILCYATYSRNMANPDPTR
jgi:hypothetical protein